jgi:signal-transduction protein with cAMP-binding, CBS, and nucleotidyltransferase domain
MVKKTIKSCKIFKGVTVKDSDSAVQIAEQLRKFQERRIIVLDKNEFPIGIISIVDINDRVVAEAKDLKKTKAKDFMSYPIKLVFESKDDLEDAKEQMIHLDTFYCPVIENGKFKGIVNYSSVLEGLNKNGKKS